MFVLNVVRSLDNQGVRYAIIGGYAVALHGAIRGTVDIDLVIAMEEKQYEAAERALQKLGLQSRLPVSAKEVFDFREEYIQNRNMMAWNFYHPSNPLEQVDLLITEDADKIQKQEKLVGKQVLKVATIDEIIKMKTKSGRPQDMEDIKALEQLK